MSQNPGEPSETAPQPNESNATISHQSRSREPMERKLTGPLWALVVISTVSSTFLYALDNTIMANIRPGVIRSLNHIELLPWISVAYPMGEVGSCPLWGTLYTSFNNKFLYLWAVLMFEIGSTVIGSAQFMGAFIAGRVICGLAGSGIYVGIMNIISGMTMAAERAQYLGFVGVAWALGTILGPITGGALNDSSATWRWSFYLNICIAAAAAPACIFLIPSISPAKHGRTNIQQLKKIDFLGSTLFLGGIASVTMILGFGGAVWSWDSGRMIGLYVALAVIWTLFTVQQITGFPTTNRAFPIEFVSNWETCILFSQCALSIANIVVTIYMLPLFFQFVYGDSALRSGRFVLPFAAVAVVSSAVGGALFPKFSFYMPWFAAGGGLMLVGSVLLATITSSTSRSTICGYSAIQGFGSGLVVQLPFTVAQVKLKEPNEVRRVTAFLSCGQMAGLALSLGAATCLFFNKTVSDLRVVLPFVSEDILRASIGGAGTSSVEALTANDRQEVLGVIGKNVALSFYFSVAGGTWGFLSSFLLKRERLLLEKSVGGVEEHTSEIQPEKNSSDWYIFSFSQ